MISIDTLDTLSKGDMITYLYISQHTGLPCCLKGFVVGLTHIVDGKACRFLLVKDNYKGTYIREGNGFILKGWHDVIEWEKEKNGQKFMIVNVNLESLIKFKGLNKYKIS